ncbi:hypothetical protein HN51_036429, partial [Arachis hypogaea]
ETIIKNGLNTTTYFWLTTQVYKGPWNCPLNFCRYYNSSVPFEDRVDAILSYVDLPSDEIPDFMTLYLEDPDHQGHKVGADDPQITEADSRIDKMIGWLFSGLEQRGIFYDVTIIMVGDHGMVTTCDKKQIFSNDLAPWINVLDNWVISHTPLLAIMPPSGYSPLDVVAKMNQGLSFGKFENGKHLKLEEGFKVKQKRSKNKECGGSHGYDNEFFSMRSIFIGHVRVRLITALPHSQRMFFYLLHKEIHARFRNIHNHWLNEAENANILRDSRTEVMSHEMIDSMTV